MTDCQVKNLLSKIRQELISIAHAEQISTRDLAGWCALSSYVIHKILRRKGYRPTFCINDDHAFLYWKGHYVDITITQFGKCFPAIYYSTKPAKGGYHDITKRTRHPKDIWRRLCRGWCMPLRTTHPRIKKMIETF